MDFFASTYCSYTTGCHADAEYSLTSLLIFSLIGFLAMKVLTLILKLLILQLVYSAKNPWLSSFVSILYELLFFFNF